MTDKEMLDEDFRIWKSVRDRLRKPVSSSVTEEKCCRSCRNFVDVEPGDCRTHWESADVRA